MNNLILHEYICDKKCSKEKHDEKGFSILFFNFWKKINYKEYIFDFLNNFLNKFSTIF